MLGRMNNIKVENVSTPVVQKQILMYEGTPLKKSEHAQDQLEMIVLGGRAFKLWHRDLVLC